MSKGSSSAATVAAALRPSRELETCAERAKILA